MTAYDFPPDPWLAPAAERTCERCGHVLVGEDERGTYYQVPLTENMGPLYPGEPDTVLTFMDRVHACEGKPHQLPGVAGTTGCPDCGVVTGEPHDGGCDVARCLVTGMQRLMCDGQHVDIPYPGCFVPRDCGLDLWTGMWPGEAECAEYGWWAFFRDPPPGGQYGAWEPCAADHPDAIPDLNRLVRECRWDQERARWVIPS